jgi:hypothetical protein
MKWTTIDFPKKISDTIKIDSMNKEGSFVVRYLEPCGDYKTVAWNPIRQDEKHDAFTTRVLSTVKKVLGL